MCLLCVEIAKGKMTRTEVDQALKEFDPKDPHLEVVKEKASGIELTREEEELLRTVIDYFPVYFDENGDE